MPNDPHDLGPLLDRARAGDAAAWNDLLGRLRPYICVLIRRQLNDALESSDLAQESLLKMQRGFADFRGEHPAQLIAWVRQIVARVVIDRRKKVPPPVMPLSELSDSDGGAPARAISEEDMARLASALERLPQPYRSVVEARFLDGRKAVDLAADLGRTPEWVRITCKRGIEKLRELLQQP